MRIAFLIERQAYYKVFGSIINEALISKHQVFCLHDYSNPKTGPKGYQFPSLDQMPLFKSGAPESISFNNQEELLRIIKNKGIEAIVTVLVIPKYIPLSKELKKLGVFWAAIQSSADLASQGSCLHLPDRYLIYSGTWLELSMACLAGKGVIKQEDIPAKTEALKSRVKSTGFPEIEQIGLIDPDSVRTEWGIPKGKPVVLFLPFPFHCTSDKFWAPFIYGLHNRLLQLPLALLSFNRRYISQAWHRWNDKGVTMAVKKFCQKNNAYLLVKARKKEPPRKYLTKIADKVIYNDDSYYPTTILKCLSVSDICLNFFSFTVLETVPMGVPNVCIAPSLKDYKNLKAAAFQTIFKKQRQIFDWPGLSYILSIADAIKLLPEKSIKDFPFLKEKQNQYLQRFIGKKGDNCSKNAVIEIENLVNSSKTR